MKNWVIFPEVLPDYEVLGTEKEVDGLTIIVTTKMARELTEVLSYVKTNRPVFFSIAMESFIINLLDELQVVQSNSRVNRYNDLMSFSKDDLADMVIELEDENAKK